MASKEYPFNIRKLAEEEGDGYLIEYPDLPGCMSDGETIIETIENGQDAVEAWLAVAKENGRDIPDPHQAEQQSGKWVQRVPKSLHTQLVKQAKHEGISLNMLVVFMLAAAVGSTKKINHQK